MPWELNISASDLDRLSDRPRAGAVTKKEPSMDEAAFRVFYAETARPLFGYLLRVSGERACAEDLMQEAYCRFLSVGLPSIDRSECKSYLFRIATNLLHDRWRRRKEDPLPEDVAEMDAHPHALDAKLEIRRALDQLKRRERELLWLAYVEGFSHKEIAACTGLRAGSIRMLLFRARRRLTELIGRNPHDRGLAAEVHK